MQNKNPLADQNLINYTFANDAHYLRFKLSAETLKALSKQTKKQSTFLKSLLPMVRLFSTHFTHEAVHGKNEPSPQGCA